MPIETSYTDLRQHLASYIDKVVDDCETVVVKRRKTYVPSTSPTGTWWRGSLADGPRLLTRI